jgi:hypothetical protein
MAPPVNTSVPCAKIAQFLAELGFLFADHRRARPKALNGFVEGIHIDCVFRPPFVVEILADIGPEHMNFTTRLGPAFRAFQNRLLIPLVLIVFAVNIQTLDASTWNRDGSS